MCMKACLTGFAVSNGIHQNPTALRRSCLIFHGSPPWDFHLIPGLMKGLNSLIVILLTKNSTESSKIDRVKYFNKVV